LAYSFSIDLSTIFVKVKTVYVKFLLKEKINHVTWKAQYTIEGYTSHQEKKIGFLANIGHFEVVFSRKTGMI
jgi:hypothetical protein